MPLLRDIVARLAAGSEGRTEADIQSDIRSVLLEAPLELDDDQVLDVGLEVHAGGGRRIDIEAGFVAIEVKKNLASKSARETAVAQLAGYVKQRTEARDQRYVGVLTDGRLWLLYHLKPDGSLVAVNRLLVRGPEDADRLAAWLECILATTNRIQPTPKEIVGRLGARSPAAELDLADLRALYESCRNDPEVQLKRELWARLLLSALGTNFEDSDELFITHTYLVLTAELVAHQVMGLPINVPGEDLRALLEGQQFAIAGLHGVVDADFFDWPAVVDGGRPVVAAIARRLSTFDWSHVEHDVLKVLYESLIDADTRRKLGEYYTPDWLAEKIVGEQLTDPLHQRVLDPACGSGTFLFWAIRRVLDACDEAGIPNRDALDHVVDRVQGMDLHPVAVTLARVTYLLALTPKRLADRGELAVPVFLGDSVRWQPEITVLAEDGMTIPTPDPGQLVDDDLHFPESVVEEPRRFDRLVVALAARAGQPRRGSKPPDIAGLLNAHNVAGADDRAAIVTVFNKLCRLHDAGRDHIWSYYIRNLARPFSFSRPEGQVDVLVGNPPWLAYRSMPKPLQATYRTLAERHRLWAGGKVATHQDLSDLFVARSVELYLKPTGSFAFVMPFAVLSRRQFAGFRTGAWSHDGGGANVAFARAEEFARIKPPLFPVPSCVVSGTKSAASSPLPVGARTWTGRIPNNHHVDWKRASTYIDGSEGDVAAATDSSESPYRSRFRQGASLVPRMLITVERRDSGPLGITAGRAAVQSARSANEKRPWKDLPGLEGVVEETFVTPVHLGATMVAYRARTPALAILPIVAGQLIDSASERLDEFPGLARWWREAERVWIANRTESTRLTLLEQIDFQGKLRKQLPVAQERVVYTKSGQHLAACRIDDPQALIDHKLYWCAVDSADEGRYLSAVLNSQALTDAVVGLQSRGQHNPRDFDMHVFALPFPTFDAADALHRDLAVLARHAEEVAVGVDLESAAQFQKARRMTRDALRQDGVADEIDEAVRELISSATARHDNPQQADGQKPTPDLMTAMSSAHGKALGKRANTPKRPLRHKSRTPDSSRVSP